MFGYFKLDKECPTKLFSQYKKYYCFLCRTLGKHYGVAARFTLSYDIAFLAMLVTDASLLKEINKVSILEGIQYTFAYEMHLPYLFVLKRKMTLKLLTR